MFGKNLESQTIVNALDCQKRKRLCPFNHNFFLLSPIADIWGRIKLMKCFFAKIILINILFFFLPRIDPPFCTFLTIRISSPFFFACSANGLEVKLGTASIATVMILDDDHSGVFAFPEAGVEISESTGLYLLRVSETNFFQMSLLCMCVSAFFQFKNRIVSNMKFN